MIETHGVLLVRRRRWWVEGAAHRPRSCALALSEEQVACAYRGIDGEPWPDAPLPFPRDGGLLPLERWPAIAAIAAEHAGYDAIVLARPDVAIEIRDVVFLGFDVGFFSDEYSDYSSIYHEAIHGHEAELRDYARKLNDSLLLATIADADSYNGTRDELRRLDRDVEDDDCYAIAIYGLARG